MENGGGERDAALPEDVVDVDDRVFRALGHEVRRFVCYYLLEHRTASVEELADVVTGWSAAETRGMALPADRDRVVVALVHRHLPALAESGLIRYDASAESVALDVDAEPILALLEWAYRVEGVERSS